MKARSFCGWCADGHCCGGRAFPSFTCLHTWRCEPMLSPAERRARDEHIKNKALARAARWREDTKEEEMFMMQAIHEGWLQLDREVDAIMEATASGASDSTLLPMKARSRGKAELLALFLPHPFDTADDVAKEALARWKARQDGEVRQTLSLPTTAKAEAS